MMENNWNDNFKNKFLYWFGIVLILFGAFVLIQALVGYINLLPIDNKIFFDIIQFFVYILLGGMFIFCGAGFKEISKDVYSFFKKEEKNLIGNTKYKHISVFVISDTLLLIINFQIFEEKVRGQFTESLSQLAFVVVVIYCLMVYHYKKIIESQKEEKTI